MFSIGNSRVSSSYWTWVFIAGLAWGTGDVTVDFAVAIDLEWFIEEALICRLVVVEGVGVLRPGAHLELDAESSGKYNGGFIISFFIGFMNLFTPFMSYYIINQSSKGDGQRGIF